MIAKSYLTLFSIITSLITIFAVLNVWDASVDETKTTVNASYDEGLTLTNDAVQSYITTVNNFKISAGSNTIYREI